MIGRTIKKEMKTERLFADNHIKQITTMEATGILFTHAIYGHRKVSTRENLPARHPRSTPRTVPRQNPRTM